MRPSEAAGHGRVPIDELSRPGHPLLKIAGGFAAVVTVIVIAAMSSELRDSPIVPPVSASGAAPPALALLSMEAQRSTHGLVVTGRVRRRAPVPAGGMVAVVSAFNRSGRLVRSGRAPLEPGEGLGRGASFTVELPDAAEVARYRVSFRGNGGIIRHDDLRPGGPESGASRADRTLAAGSRSGQRLHTIVERQRTRSR